MGVKQSRIRSERAQFESDILPHLSSLMEQGTNLTVDELFTLFVIFTSIDKDLDGTISCNEFHKLLGIKVTLLSERIFLILDKERTGNTGLHDFVLGIHELCHMTMDDFSALAFHIFDIDRTHILSMEECDALLRMLKGEGTTEADPDHMRHIASYCRDDGRTITLARFQESVRLSTPCIVQPMLDVQMRLSKVLEEWRIPD